MLGPIALPADRTRRRGTRAGRGGGPARLTDVLLVLTVLGGVNLTVRGGVNVL
ncbi:MULTISPECIES: hypothetical protein [unclassified Streptomyces]|uniref:hypothetical protein n=1 Tax=unclassified Streptomyces TaxID=2593676 RepID=UPI000AB4B025|nr:hypothetical protein [Streptomyces sp. NRRL F-5630]